MKVLINCTRLDNDSNNNMRMAAEGYIIQYHCNDMHAAVAFEGSDDHLGSPGGAKTPLSTSLLFPLSSLCYIYAWNMRRGFLLSHQPDDGCPHVDAG